MGAIQMAYLQNSMQKELLRRELSASTDLVVLPVLTGTLFDTRHMANSHGSVVHSDARSKGLR